MNAESMSTYVPRLVSVAVLLFAASLDSGYLLQADEPVSETLQESAWPERVSALSRVVAAVRAELAKAGSDADELNKIARTQGNELDEDDVQQALMRLLLGRLVSHEGKKRRVVSTDSVLVHAYEKYRELRKQARQSWERERIEDIGNNLRDLLRSRDLMGVVNAVFRAGMVIADASNDGHTRFDWVGGAVRTRPAAVVLWRTRMPRRWFVPGLGGGFGYEAVPAVWSFPRMDESDSEAECGVGMETDLEQPESNGRCYVVQHQDGFFYDVFTTWPNVRVGGGQLSGFLGGGQARLTGPKLTLTVEDTARVTTLAKNRTGMWSYRWEAGIEYRLFDADRVALEYGRAAMSPAFELAFGLRTRERFKARQDLEFLERKDVDMQDPGNPRQRLFWRLGIDLRRVVFLGGEELSGKTNPFSVRLVAEQELDRPGRHVPTTTRIFIQGEIALKKLGFAE